MTREEQVALIRDKYTALAPLLNERTRRCWAATEAQALGYGGISWVAEALGMARGTIHAGRAEVQARQTRVAPKRIRRVGGGRQKLTAKDLELEEALNELVEPTTRGDPESPLRWTCKSTTQLAKELEKLATRLVSAAVCTLLHALQYSLQANRKTREGSTHPDRDAQFQYHQRQRQAVSASQTTRDLGRCEKEGTGRGILRRRGGNGSRKGTPEKVSVHDFADPAAGQGNSLRRL